MSKLLVGAAQEIGNDKTEDDRLALFLTGGWVRDKLLGTRGVDTDAGINSMSGYNFATRSVHIGASMEKYGFERCGVSNTERNPEMCKNLGAAIPKILGWISTL